MTEISSDDQDRSDMRSLAGGHDAALNDLMDRHGQRLFHYLLRQLGNESKANELAQESFVKVYLNRTKFRAESKFSTWLYAIATNLVRDHLRWSSRHPEISLEAHEDENQSLGDVLPDNIQSPSDRLISRERAEQVQRAIQSLPEDLRTPFLLAEYEELPQAEIAAVLNCTIKAVETRIYRARQALRKSLADMIETR